MNVIVRRGFADHIESLHYEALWSPDGTSYEIPLSCGIFIN